MTQSASSQKKPSRRQSSAAITFPELCPQGPVPRSARPTSKLMRGAERWRAVEIETPFGTSRLSRFIAIWAAIVFALILPALF